MLSCRLHIDIVAGGESAARSGGSAVTVKQFPNLGRSTRRPAHSFTVTVTTCPEGCAGMSTRAPDVANTTEPPWVKSIVFESQSPPSHAAPFSMRNLIGKLRPSTSPMNSPVCAFFRPALVAMGSTSACPSSCVPSRTRIRYSFVSTRLGDLVSQFTWYFWPGKSRFTSLAVEIFSGERKTNDSIHVLLSCNRLGWKSSGLGAEAILSTPERPASSVSWKVGDADHTPWKLSMLTILMICRLNGSSPAAHWAVGAPEK